MSNKIQPKEISEELAWEIYGLLYSKWKDAHEDLKKVKEEKNDGSKDWNLFHEARLEHTTKRVSTARYNLDKAMEAFPIKIT